MTGNAPTVVHFASHGFTRHGQGEYVDLVDRTIHTNAIEGAFSVFKRGLTSSPP